MIEKLQAVRCTCDLCEHQEVIFDPDYEKFDSGRPHGLWNNGNPKLDSWQSSKDNIMRCPKCARKRSDKLWDEAARKRSKREYELEQVRKAKEAAELEAKKGHRRVRERKIKK